MPPLPSPHLTTRGRRNNKAQQNSESNHTSILWWREHKKNKTYNKQQIQTNKQGKKTATQRRTYPTLTRTHTHPTPCFLRDSTSPLPPPPPPHPLSPMTVAEQKKSLKQQKKTPYKQEESRPPTPLSPSHPPHSMPLLLSSLLTRPHRMDEGGKARLCMCACVCVWLAGGMWGGSDGSHLDSSRIKHQKIFGKALFFLSISCPFLSSLLFSRPRARISAWGRVGKKRDG